MLQNRDNKEKILNNRFILFTLFLVAFIVIQLFFSKSALPSNEANGVWFYSGLFMVLFSILFIEPYFSSPKNVLTNSIPLLILFLSIKPSFVSVISWWIAISLLLLLIVFSIMAITLQDNNTSPDHITNKISEKLKSIVVLFGQGKVLYSSVFIYFLLSYYSIQNLYTLILFVTWFLILSINPKSIHNRFPLGLVKENQNDIGQIFSVLSNNVFLVKTYKDKKNIGRFDLVKFNFPLDDHQNQNYYGIILEDYLLDDDKWIKVLQIEDSHEVEGKLEENSVRKVTEIVELRETIRSLKINELVGIVCEGTTTEIMKFEYTKKNDDLEEGDLLELSYGERRLFYQVVKGTIHKEILEYKNETGYIKGEAIQLGEWNNTELSFHKYGWVPKINTPIFRADTSNIQIPNIEPPEYKLGIIPKTTLPSIINLDDALSHHIALLGITGAGKSYIAREIITQLLSEGTRVLCMDFTGEWRKSIGNTELFEGELKTPENVTDYLQDPECLGKIGIIELPELSNTVQVIDRTQKLLSSVFDFAKKSYDGGNVQKICLILEEAHTIIPESNFLGVNNWDSKAIVNKIGQIALQGRKFGVGLMVIAQRTAIVSKTVLTQCNTVICFQAFDETSFKFLGNYVGEDTVRTLPNLKKYHAIVAGKAVKSKIPMIIDLTRNQIN